MLARYVTCPSLLRCCPCLSKLCNFDADFGFPLPLLFQNINYRAVAELPNFVNLELNGNQISEAGLEAVKGVLSQAGKVLGG